MLLSSADISWMQTTQLGAMPGTVVIQRRSMTPDGMGGAEEAWAAAGTAVGRIYPKQASNITPEGVGGAQVLSMTQWYGTFPVGTDVVAQDRLLYNSRTWEVQRVNNDEMWQTCVRCELLSMNEEQRT